MVAKRGIGKQEITEMSKKKKSKQTQNTSWGSVLFPCSLFRADFQLSRKLKQTCHCTSQQILKCYLEKERKEKSKYLFSCQKNPNPFLGDLVIIYLLLSENRIQDNWKKKVKLTKKQTNKQTHKEFTEETFALLGLSDNLSVVSAGLVCAPRVRVTQESRQQSASLWRPLTGPVFSDGEPGDPGVSRVN